MVISTLRRVESIRFSFKLLLIYSLCLIMVSRSCTLDDLETYTYPIGKDIPVRFEEKSLRFSLSFSVPDSSLLRGNITLDLFKGNCSLPIQPKRVTSLGFYTLDLTQMEIDYPMLNPSPRTIDLYERLYASLELSLESFIPTLFQVDPYSYRIYLYDENEHTCREPGPYSMIGVKFSFRLVRALNKKVKFGVYAYKGVEVVKFERSVSIHYPRSILYVCSNDIRNLQYTFPKAEIMEPSISPSMSVSRYYVPYSGIPEQLVILARFQVSLFSQPLNMTDATITIRFQQSTNFFVDVNGNLVEIIFESLASYLLIEGNLIPVESQFNVNFGLLACKLKSEYNVDHDMFIVANARKPHSPSNSNKPIPTDLMENTTEKVVIRKGTSRLFKIDIPRGCRLLLGINYLSILKEGLPIYLATDYIPTNTAFTKKLTSTGFYHNTETKRVTCFILVENLIHEIAAITLTPTLEFSEANPPNTDNKALAVVFGTLSAFFCVLLIPLTLTILILYKRGRLEPNQLGPFHNGYGSVE